MNDKTTHVNSGDLLLMVSGEIRVGVVIIIVVDVEEEEGELEVMDWTLPYDGQLILGGLVVQGMKVLLEVLHGNLTSFYSTFFFCISYLLYSR